LKFSNTRSLSGTLPWGHFEKLVNLQELWITSTAVSGTLSPQIGELANLTSIDFNNVGWRRSALTGTIPTQIGRLAKLTSLSFYYTVALSGTVPSEIGMLFSLQTLNAAGGNRVSGTIPPQLGGLVHATTFNFYNAKRVSGTLPVSLGKLHKADYFSFQSTRISGTIPDSYGNLTLASRFNFRWTAISGTMPSGFLDFTEMYDLQLSDNMDRKAPCPAGSCLIEPKQLKTKQNVCLCVGCPPGKASMPGALLVCGPCPTGTFMDGRTCISCPEGRW
jgi:hypothetical protein